MRKLACAALAFAGAAAAAHYVLPFGALLMSLLIGWKFKTKNLVVTECEQSGHKFWGYGFFNFCFKWVTPIGMVIVLIGQIMDFFL